MTTLLRLPGGHLHAMTLKLLVPQRDVVRGDLNVLGARNLDEREKHER